MWAVRASLLIGSVLGQLRLDPLVDTSQGLIRGLKADDGDYSKFLGIPYAKVDISNPFGVALPYPKFETTFEAYDDSSVCPQRGRSGEVQGTLDCLKLNIFVPDKATTINKLPVLFWIHGGGFETGSGGTMGPKFLVEKDIILVTINYRLGPYGFMCLDTSDVPGNQGLKDQYKALEWIKANIAAFGGDVDKITVSGESAGSMSVDFHLLSTRPNIFHQAILQSGTAICPEEVVMSDRTVPIKIARYLGFITEDMSEAMSFLSNTDEKLVIAASKGLDIYYRSCVEKEFENVESFVSRHPERTVPNIKAMPILQGYNSHEQMGSYLNTSPDEFKVLKPFEKDLKLLFEFGDNYDEMEDIVRHFYIGDEEFSENVRWELIDFASDSKFAYPTQRSLARYLRNGAENIYHYMFSYVGDRKDMMMNSNVTVKAASHGAELPYLFDMSPAAKTTEKDQLVTDRMTTMWANFVKYGNPTPEVTELLPVQWPLVTNDSFSFLNIDADLTVSTRPYHARLTFWDLYYKFNQDKMIAYIHYQ